MLTGLKVMVWQILTRWEGLKKGFDVSTVHLVKKRVLKFGKRKLFARKLQAKRDNLITLFNWIWKKILFEEKNILKKILESTESTVFSFYSQEGTTKDARCVDKSFQILPKKKQLFLKYKGPREKWSRTTQFWGDPGEIFSECPQRSN